MANNGNSGGTPFLSPSEYRAIINLQTAQAAQGDNSGLYDGSGSIADYTGLLQANLKTTLDSGSNGIIDNKNYSQGQPFGNYPDGHEPFDEVQAGAIPIVGGLPVVVLRYPIPSGYAGVIERYSLNFTGGGFDGFNLGDLIWRMFVGSKLVKNFDKITSERGTYQSPRTISNLRVTAGDIFTITVEHPSNEALNGTSLACISGYTYPLVYVG